MQRKNHRTGMGMQWGSRHFATRPKELRGNEKAFCAGRLGPRVKSFKKRLEAFGQ